MDERVSAACEKLDKITSKAKPKEKAEQIAAYDEAVDSLIKQGWLTAAQAGSLKSLAAAL